MSAFRLAVILALRLTILLSLSMAGAHAFGSSRNYTVATFFLALCIFIEQGVQNVERTS